MRLQTLALALAATCLCGSFSGYAQTPPAANPLDAVPEGMPFDIPYGPPISLERAQAAIAAAVAEAKKHNWKLNVAVVDSGANLVAFQRMDGAQLASIVVAEHKARAAASFRRETRVMGGWHSAKAELLHAHTRWGNSLARRDSAGCRGEINRRDRLLGRHRLPGRGGVQGRCSHRQVIQSSKMRPESWRLRALDATPTDCGHSPCSAAT